MYTTGPSVATRARPWPRSRHPTVLDPCCSPRRCRVSLPRRPPRFLRSRSQPWSDSGRTCPPEFLRHRLRSDCPYGLVAARPIARPPRRRRGRTAGSHGWAFLGPASGAHPAAPPGRIEPGLRGHRAPASRAHPAPASVRRVVDMTCESRRPRSCRTQAARSGMQSRGGVLAARGRAGPRLRAVACVAWRRTHLSSTRTAAAPAPARALTRRRRPVPRVRPESAGCSVIGSRSHAVDGHVPRPVAESRR